MLPKNLRKNEKKLQLFREFRTIRKKTHYCEILNMLVRFVFVSHLIEQLVVILPRCTGYLIWVMLSTYRLLLVALSLKLICLLRGGVSWLTLVRLVTLICSLGIGLTVCFLIEHTIQTWFIVWLRRLKIYSTATPVIACWSWLSCVIIIKQKAVYSS